MYHLLTKNYKRKVQTHSLEVGINTKAYDDEEEE